MVMEIGKVK
jgi:hypothetical protein